MPVQPLSWDSDFLGFAVGRLQGPELPATGLDSLLDKARQQGYRLLYWFVPPGSVAAAALQACPAARLADHKVRLCMPVATGQPNKLPAGIISAPDYSPALRALAPQAGAYSRFRTDPDFAPEMHAQLYQLWLGRSLGGEPSREVLVYQPDNPAEPVRGFLALTKHECSTEMSLMAVEPVHRGQGIGAAFIAAARVRAAATGHAVVQLTTQAHNPACRLYRREGFVQEYEELVYHVWL